MSEAKLVEAIEDAGIDRIQWDVMHGGIGPSTLFRLSVVRRARHHV